MIEFKKNSFIITVENANQEDYVRMFETLIWVIGHMLEQNENYVDLHTLAWLAAAMVPSENNLKSDA